jgi:hypothetical protein
MNLSSPSDDVGGALEIDHDSASLKQPHSAITETSSLSASSITPRSKSSAVRSSFFQPPPKKGKTETGLTQMRLCGNAVDPNATYRMHVAIADFLHSHCLPFSLAEDPKLAKIIEIGRTLGPHYKPPFRQDIGGKYLDAIYETNWKEQMRTLLSEARVFGLTVFGDGATIKTVPLVNVLAAGVNNPFALLDIADCTDHLSNGGKKDAMHIAKIIMPLIELIHSEPDVHNKKSPGIVDLVFFDGASNVQNAGEILRIFNPRITVGHGAEHVVSLFFSDVYNKVPEFKRLSDFAKRVRNIFGSVRHSPSAMFKKYTRLHNKGIHLGFIKPSECRMAGEHIALLRLLRLKNALRATITSKEFIELRVFHSITGVLMNPDFWRYLFVMCRALYAPMRVLRLADQKSPAMDKLYYYVIQTDQMLLKYIADAEERGGVLLTESTLEGMKSQSAGISDDDMEDESDGDNDDEEVPEESGDDDDSDSNEKQVSLM